MAEDFVVDDFLKPAVLNVIDSSQYGAVPKSSSTLTLISILHTWSLETDRNGSTVTTLLFDYRKAFHVIDHSILVNKLRNLAVPRSIINWIIDFLSNPLKRTKLEKGSYSKWGPILSGVPQGTKLGHGFLRRLRCKNSTFMEIC